MFRMNRAAARAAIAAMSLALIAGSGGDVPASPKRDERKALVEIVELIPGEREGLGEVVTLRASGDGLTGDPEVDEAFDAAYRVLDYFEGRFGRDGHDGRGETLTVYVRYRDDGLVAVSGAWDWELEHIVVGRGWVDDDVIAHEFGHGVMQAEVGLGDPSTEFGALREAIADIFAASVDDDWTIGEGLLAGAVRDPAHPERFDHPAHTDDYDPFAGAIHANSTILSHAYYLLAKDVGRPTAEQIVYAALTDHLTAASGFEQFRTACLQAAAERYGAVERAAVDRAFRAVGLDGTWRVPS